MRSYLILINGYPGVGKYTIAKLVHNALGSESRFIHNHLLIDPVEAIHPGRTADHWALRKKFRDVAFDDLIANSNSNLTIIITVSLAANNDDIVVMHEHLRIARERELPVYWINLICDEREHKNRMVSDERKFGGTSKCTDPAVLDAIKARTGTTLLTPADVANEIRDLSVDYQKQDTSRQSQEECAQVTLQWMKRKS
jgi:hypothetical protein